MAGGLYSRPGPAKKSVAMGRQAAAIIRSTSATISRRWKGLDRTLACLGASEAGCSATAAKPVMNMIFRAAFSSTARLASSIPSMPGHHDIGQQQVEGEALEAFIGVAAIAEIGHGMAGLDQRRGKELAQGFVVFRQKDMRHACPALPAPTKTHIRGNRKQACPHLKATGDPGLRLAARSLP